MLPSETLEAFRKGTLELWCPKMIVRQQDSSKTVEYVGSGLIRQSPARQLSFMLLESFPASPSEDIRRMLGNTEEVGNLLPNEKYHSLEATDLFGWVWKADRFLVHTNRGPGGSIVSGDIYILEHAEQADASAATIHLEILEDVAVPFTGVTEKVVKVGEVERTSVLRNVAKFSVGTFEFTLTKEDGLLLIEAVSAESNPPQHFETRIIESLQYVTARTFSWGILVRKANGSSVTCLRSLDKGVLPARLSLPINYPHADYEGRWLWSLFCKYLQRIWDFQGKDRFEMHPVSAWLHYVRNASTGSVFTKGLALGVAVEGILNAEFSDVGAISSEHAKALDKMIGYVKSWKGDERVRERTLGALGAMRKPRAKDRLLALQTANIVRGDDVVAWDTIRNKGAHARPPERQYLQKWIDNCFKVEVLLNHLIFRSIGYEGEFTDYGSPSWPRAVYPIAGAQ